MHRDIRRLLAFGIMAFSLAGCETMASKARINPNTVAVYTPTGPTVVAGAKAAAGDGAECPLIAGGGGDSRRDAINLKCFTLPGDNMTAYARAQVDPGGRNRFEAVLLKQADDICVLEKGRMVANQSSTNTGLSLATTSLSSVSTIVGGELAKSILSGAAAITSGAQDHINANFYRNQIVQAITKSIDGDRASILTDIVAKRGGSLQDYPVDEMIRMVNRYHQACSFEHGLQTLLDATVNASGYRAMIEYNNLQTAIDSLKTNMTDRSADPDMEKRLKDLVLKQASLLDQIGGTTVPLGGK